MTEQEENHEIRTLRWRNKQLGKQLGKAGQKIHELRCQLAASREINGKIARGRLQYLENHVAQLLLDNKWLLERNSELLDKLRASETQHVVTDARA